MSQAKALPKEWKWVKLGEVAELSSEKHAPTKEEHLFYVGLEHIEKKNGRLTESVGIEKINTIKNKFRKGNILYGKLRPNFGKTYLAKEGGVCSTDILVFKIKQNCKADYLLHFMLSRQFVNDMSENTSGVNLPRVSTKYVQNYQVPLPPLSIQAQIVEKLETLLSELDKGKAQLLTAQAQLKTYRQAVLKYAFEGKLTGNTEGWQWVKIGDIADVGTGVTPLRTNKSFWDNGTIPWITSGALNDDNVSESKEFITETALKETSLKIYPKHTLLIALYGEGKTRGKCSELLFESTTNQAIAGIKLKVEFSGSRKFLKLFLLKQYQDLRTLASGGVQPNLNLSLIKNTELPFPPLSIQTEIVLEIERRLSVCDHLEGTIKTSLAQSETLRQSLLKQAFEGRLV
jgi:type I restriction enzyme, S subunit